MGDYFRYLIFWAQQHPLVVVAAFVGFLAVWWLLNRKSSVDREAERVVKSLIEGSRDKYKDTRPLR